MSTNAVPLDTAPALTHRQILTILSGLLLGMFLAALDQTVVATAIRTISDDLKGFSLQAWATTAFLITSTIVTPLYGKLSDIYGRKPFFIAAISIFTLGSILCGLAGSMYQLAAYRAVQGIGAGGLFSLALAILGDIVPPRERSRYQAYFLAVFGSSSVLGPVIGGFLAGRGTIFGVDGWRWIFYVNVPIAIVALIVVAKVLHVPTHRVDHRLDYLGAVSLTAALVPLLIIAEQGRQWGWGSPRALLCYALGLSFTALFIFAEHRLKDEALLPLRMFRGRTFSVGTVGSFVVGMGMFGGIALLPLYLQVVKGSSPTTAGFQMIPLVGGIMIGSVISGRFISSTGRYKILPVVGTGLLTAAMVLLYFITASTPIWATMLIMTLFGLGLGGNMQPMIAAVQNAVSPREIGVATSSVTFFRQLGGTLGVAVFLSVLFSSLTGNISDEYARAAQNPAFQQALAAHPDQAQLLAAGGAAALSDTSFISKLDPALAQPLKVGFTDSMNLVFILAAGVLLIGFITVLFLPELPLRQQSAAQERAALDAEDALDAASADLPSAPAVPVRRTLLE